MAQGRFPCMILIRQLSQGYDPNVLDLWAESTSIETLPYTVQLATIKLAPTSTVLSCR
jgi:hypothetical protein